MSLFSLPNTLMNLASEKRSAKSPYFFENALHGLQ